MNKELYMEELRKRLKRLPREDFERAIEYYEEYFADAGADHEQQAITDLGTPEEAANALICELAKENAQAPVENVKGGVKAVWVGILAVCAAPMALPAFFLWIGFIMLLILAVLVVAVLVVLAILMLIVMGPISVWGGCSVAAKSIPTALVCIGYGLTVTGVGLLLGYLICVIGRKFLNWLVKLFGKAAEKGGEKYEKNK